MALKDTVSKWHEASCLLERDRYSDAISELLKIKNPSAKIFYNIGCICLLQKYFPSALEYFDASIDHDKYLTISYFQRGVTYYHLERYDDSNKDFQAAKKMLPENGIDYHQLGAKIILTAEMINPFIITSSSRGCAQREHIELLPLGCISVCFFHPPKKMVASLGKADYLGKAKVVSSVQEDDIIYAQEKKNVTTLSAPVQKNISKSLPPPPSWIRNADQGNAHLASRRPPPPPRRPPSRPDEGSFSKLAVKCKSTGDLLHSSDADFVSSNQRGIMGSSTPKPTQKFHNDAYEHPHSYNHPHSLNRFKNSIHMYSALDVTDKSLDFKSVLEKTQKIPQGEVRKKQAGSGFSKESTPHTALIPPKKILNLTAGHETKSSSRTLHPNFNMSSDMQQKGQEKSVLSRLHPDLLKTFEQKTSPGSTQPPLGQKQVADSNHTSHVAISGNSSRPQTNSNITGHNMLHRNKPEMEIKPAVCPANDAASRKPPRPPPLKVTR